VDRRSPAATLLLTIALSSLGFFTLIGCERPGCENASRCVEQCFTSVFLQCAGCPAGSFPEELCDRQTVCLREEGPPGTTCDSSICTDGENGRCILTGTGEVCTYDECLRDTDCPEGRLCACRGGYLQTHVCVSAACERPEDCGDYPCSPVTGCGGPADPADGGAVALACHGAEDECFTDRQCPEGLFCTLDVASPAVDPGLWRCTEPFCI